MPQETSEQDPHSRFFHLHPPPKDQDVVYDHCTLYTYDASETSRILEGLDLSILHELGYEDIVEIQILRNDVLSVAVGVLFRDFEGDMCVIEFGPIAHSAISFYTSRDRRIQSNEDVSRRLIGLFHQVCIKACFTPYSDPSCR